MGELIAQGLTVTAGEKQLLADASFRVRPGELVAVLGPNGAGKTSLIRAALGLVRCDAGTRRLNETDMATLSPAARARQIAYLPQSRPLAWPLAVRDVVALGRYAHGVAPHRLGPEDAAAIGEAIAACGLGPLTGRRTDTLSGGELARVHIARALASRAPLLIADEPIAALDPYHQFKVMDLIAGFVRGGGGALVVLHDVSLAARYASRLIWMVAGRIVADGPVKDTLTAARLGAVYGIDATVEGSQVTIGGPLGDSDGGPEAP